MPMSPGEGHDDTASEFAPDLLALRWIAEHLDHFLPPGILDDDAKCKPLLELIFLMVFRLREGPQLDAFSAEILDRLTELADSPTLRDKPILNRNQLVLRAGACAILAFTDRRDRAQEFAVQRVIDTGLIEQSERLPHHIMIERTMFDWGGFSHGLPSLAELTAMSLLVRRPDAIYQSTLSTYEITHDIMFGYAFGERDATELSSAQRDQLHRVLTDTLVRFQHEGHWDLVGELLMCWDTMNFARDGVYDAGWSAFTASQDPDGSVPAICRPGPAEPPTREGPEPTEARFDERYHTTLVLLFAATARSRRERGVVPDAVPTQGMAHSSASVSDARWLNRLSECTDSVRLPTVLIGALIGLTLVEATEPAIADFVDDAVRRIRENLFAPTQLVGVPATLTLAAFAILRNRGVDVPALTGFVDAIRTAVSGIPPDEATAVVWCEKQVVLAQLGLADHPPLPKPSDVWRAIDRCVVPDLTEVWQLAGACTGFGTLPRRLLSDVDDVGVRRLEALGVDAFRRRDLIAGCAVLRSAHALRPLHPVRLRSVTTFLRAQQSRYGGYGVIDPAVLGTQSSVGATDVDVDVDVDVRLPTSLAVWWTLAELTTDFRLFAWDRAGISTSPVAASS